MEINYKCYRSEYVFFGDENDKLVQKKQKNGALHVAES